MPGVGFEGMQSTLCTVTQTIHVDAASQHVAAALGNISQPTQGRGDVSNMRQPAASGSLQQLPADMKQPAAAQLLQQEAPPPDGSVQPGQWRTKHKTAAQLDGSKQAASAKSLQHNEEGRCAEDEAETLKGSTRAHYACAAEGAAAMPGSRQCAVEDTVQAVDIPPWLSEQVIALAVDDVMAENCHMGIIIKTILAQAFFGTSRDCLLPSHLAAVITEPSIWSCHQGNEKVCLRCTA